MVLIRAILAFALTGFLPPERASAFVLLSGPQEARLEASEEAPEVTFFVQSNAPAITGKDRFADGAYQDLSDEDYWELLVQAAMQTWNDVEASYVTLKLEINDAAALDSSDNVHSIVVGATNATSSAYARPEVVGDRITDCDIAVSSRSAEAGDLAFTLMHELGHCLGLGHNHSDYKAAMGYSRTQRSLRLGLDDEAGVVYLYPSASVPQAKELVHCGTLGPGKLAWSPSAYWLFALPLLLNLRRRRR